VTSPLAMFEAVIRVKSAHLILIFLSGFQTWFYQLRWFYPYRSFKYSK